MMMLSLCLLRGGPPAKEPCPLSQGHLSECDSSNTEESESGSPQRQDRNLHKMAEIEAQEEKQKEAGLTGRKQICQI